MSIVLRQEIFFLVDPKARTKRYYAETRSPGELVGWPQVRIKRPCLQMEDHPILAERFYTTSEAESVVRKLKKYHLSEKDTTIVNRLEIHRIVITYDDLGVK